MLSNAEMMMQLLEQDSTHCNTLWKYYMAEKNRLLEEALCETMPDVTDGSSVQAPDSPLSEGRRSTTRGSIMAKGIFDDAAIDTKLSTVAVYEMKKEVLEASVRDGSLRIAALEDRKKKMRPEVEEKEVATEQPNTSLELETTPTPPETEI